MPHRKASEWSIKKLNIDCRKHCEFFGFTENHENESLLIFHSCSTNLFINSSDVGDTACNELHIGNTPRSIMTKGNSVAIGTPYGNFIRGNKDKLMISYRREPGHDYAMLGACGVLFEGEIHFFGGQNPLSRQHFVIETQRSGQVVKMTRKEDLGSELMSPSCASIEMTSEYFPWFHTNLVILCFDFETKKSCYSFDSKLTYIGDSSYVHFTGKLAKYKGNLLTIGGSNFGNYFGNGTFYGNKKTEILEINRSRNFSWSVVESDLDFIQGEYIAGYSLVTVEPSDMHEEYVLLIGGINDYIGQDYVSKFNGSWFLFGKLNKPRNYHNSIYWNGAVYVIGGSYGVMEANYGEYNYGEYNYGEYNYREYFYLDHYENTKIEIWDIKDSPDQFKTKENWPELFDWEFPHLFVVTDSFFPDY